MAPETWSAALNLHGNSSDTTQKFVSEKYGFAFSPPAGWTVKLSLEPGYFSFVGKDDPQFGGHVSDLTELFPDSNCVQRWAQPKVTFKSLAALHTPAFYEARGDLGTASGRVDSVHEFTSPAGLEVVVVYVAQVFDFYEPDSVSAYNKQDQHSFVVWIDISHGGRCMALIFEPWESGYEPEKALVHTMDIVNSLTLIPFKDDK